MRCLRRATSLLIACATLLAADEPLPPPSRTTRCSANGLYCATADPLEDSVAVYLKAAPVPPRWRIKGWERAFDVADSGDHLVVCYSGLNLLPLDYRPEWTMLAFYERGTLIRRVSLGELIPNLRKLRRTASHFEWGGCVGFDSVRTYQVKTVDRGVLTFDVSTGRLSTRPAQ